MKKHAEPQKEHFFELLDRAVCKDGKVKSGTKKSRKSDGCNDKRTRQHKTGDAWRPY